MRHLADRGQFGRRIDRAQLAGLAEAHRLGLDAVNAAIQAVQALGDRLRRDLSVRAVEPDQLGAGEEFGRAAFRRHDVAVLVAQRPRHRAA